MSNTPGATPQVVIATTERNPRYLVTYDSEARGGRGEANFTNELGRAKRFTSFQEALEFTRQVPRAQPMRADGKPNRPLSAWDLWFIPVETVGDGVPTTVN
jgi:hypothetical protein